MLNITGSKSPRGEYAARILRNKRKKLNWNSKMYKRKKMHLDRKFDPMGKACAGEGIVLEKVGRESKQPNSAIRKCVRVQLRKNGKIGTAFLPGDSALTFIEEHDTVTIEGIGGAYGSAYGDLPGVRWRVIKVNGVSLDELIHGRKEKSQR